MKKVNYKKDSFIGGWYIDEKVCDDLITYFEKNIHRQKVGTTGNGNRDKKIKDSIDMNLAAGDTLLDDYNKQLGNCLKEYIKIYPEVNDLSRFSSGVEPYNIQKYKPNGGYKIWHCERDGPINRCLVFMTYLNTVKNGGTNFKYQNITTQAIKGLTLIWPSDFTHMHKGQICNQTKYIITGCYNFI